MCRTMSCQLSCIEYFPLKWHNIAFRVCHAKTRIPWSLRLIPTFGMQCLYCSHMFSSPWGVSVPRPIRLTYRLARQLLVDSLGKDQYWGVFFCVISLNKLLNKYSCCRWFKTPWRHGLTCRPRPPSLSGSALYRLAHGRKTWPPPLPPGSRSGRTETRRQLDNNLGWANVGPTSGRQCRRWANVGPTYFAV